MVLTMALLNNPENALEGLYCIANYEGYTQQGNRNKGVLSYESKTFIYFFHVCDYGRVFHYAQILLCLAMLFDDKLRVKGRCMNSACT